jgi:Tfp pilus assembly protein PilO
MTTTINAQSLKPYILPIVTGLVVILVTPFAILPWFGTIQTDVQTLATQKDLYQQLVTKGNTLDTANISDLQDQLATYLEPALPSQADPAGVLGTMEQIAASSGVSTKGAQFASTAQAETASGMVKVTLGVDGGYTNVAKFIQLAENTSRVLSFDTLRITSAGTQANATVSATVDVLAPYNGVTDLGAIESPLPPKDLAMTKTLDVVKGLARASYSPTAPQSITGKANPF